MKDIKYLEVKRAYYNDPENVVVQILSSHDPEWINVEGEPIWMNKIEYRIKPKTINLNGIEVPEPVRDRLTEHQTYFLSSLKDHDLYVTRQWVGSEDDYLRLSRGLIHLTEEAAIQHSKALLSFTAKESKK